MDSTELFLSKYSLERRSGILAYVDIQVGNCTISDIDRITIYLIIGIYRDFSTDYISIFRDYEFQEKEVEKEATTFYLSDQEHFNIARKFVFDRFLKKVRKSLNLE